MSVDQHTEQQPQTEVDEDDDAPQAHGLLDADHRRTLQDELDAVVQERNAWREHQLEPRLEALEAERDDAKAVAELQQTVDNLQAQLRDVQAELDGLIGLDEAEATSPKKRATDLRQALKRRAEKNGGKAAMHWEQVQDLFADLGHGEISKPDCYKAMRWAAGTDGPLANVKAYAVEDDLVRKGNRDVRAIRVHLEDLPGATGDAPSRNPTTGHDGGVDASDGNTTNEVSNTN